MTAHRRRAGLVLIGVGSACIGALHVLHGVRTDLAPWGHRLSEYANDRAGSLMTVAFTSLGLALLVLAPVVRPHRRSIVLAIRVAGLGLLASGVFRTGVTEAGATSDALHGIVSSTATVAMIAAVVMSRRRVFAAIAVVLGVVSPITHGTVVGGLNQRLLWGTLLVWVVVSARPGGGISDPSAPSRTMVA